MGLDMTLRKRHYIAAQYKHRKVKADINISIDGVQLNINPSKIEEIFEIAMLWRKANQIHGWFVRNIQDNEDNCEEYEVPTESLQKLLALCQQVLKNRDKAQDLLPIQKGFFFGSTKYDEGYFQDLKDTVDSLELILKEDETEADYYYRSSW